MRRLRQHVLFSVACASAFVFASTTVAAHGDATSANEVSVTLVLGATVVAGAVSGAVGLGCPAVDGLSRFKPVAFGAVLIALGGSLLASAAADGRVGLLIGLLVGTAAVGVGTGADGICSCRADVLTGAVFGHRLIEGLLLGVLLDADSGVAAIGAAAIAGHAAVELAVLGRSYRAAGRVARGVGALVVVSAGFVGAAAAGVAVASAVPGVVRTAVLAAAGVVLFVLGVTEWRASERVLAAVPT